MLISPILLLDVSVLVVGICKSIERLISHFLQCIDSILNSLSIVIVLPSHYWTRLLTRSIAQSEGWIDFVISLIRSQNPVLDRHHILFILKDPIKRGHLVMSPLEKTKLLPTQLLILGPLPVLVPLRFLILLSGSELQHVQYLVLLLPPLLLLHVHFPVHAAIGWVGGLVNHDELAVEPMLGHDHLVLFQLLQVLWLHLFNPSLYTLVRIVRLPISLLSSIPTKSQVNTRVNHCMTLQEKETALNK